MRTSNVINKETGKSMVSQVGGGQCKLDPGLKASPGFQPSITDTEKDHGAFNLNPCALLSLRATTARCARPPATSSSGLRTTS